MLKLLLENYELFFFNERGAVDSCTKSIIKLIISENIDKNNYKNNKNVLILLLNKSNLFLIKWEQWIKITMFCFCTYVYTVHGVCDCRPQYAVKGGENTKIILLS